MLTVYLTPEQVDILDAMLEVVSDSGSFMRLEDPNSKQKYRELFCKFRDLTGRGYV